MTLIKEYNPVIQNGVHLPKRFGEIAFFVRPYKVKRTQFKFFTYQNKSKIPQTGAFFLSVTAELIFECACI